MDGSRIAIIVIYAFLDLILVLFKCIYIYNYLIVFLVIVYSQF